MERSQRGGFCVGEVAGTAPAELGPPGVGWTGFASGLEVGVESLGEGGFRGGWRHCVDGG